jgi:hypothetical protein
MAQVQSSLPGLRSANSNSSSDRMGDIITRVQRLLDEGKPQEAFDQLNVWPYSPDIRLRNARGVCLLRLKSYDKAVRVFRELVLAPNAIALRDDVPLTPKINFAIALLMSGKITGGIGILEEISKQSDPAVESLREAVRIWKSRLSFGQKLYWFLGADPVEPFVPDDTPGKLF